VAEQLKLDFKGRGPRRLAGGEPAAADASVSATSTSASQARLSAQRLVKRLAALVGEPVRLVVTDNRHTMISARRDRGTLVVRVHHMFLAADDATITALGHYLGRGNRQASARLDEFIAGHRAALGAARRRATVIHTRGEHHDLEEILDGLAARHFGGPIDARITWGRRARRRGRKHSIQLGTYLADERLIRIHPVLDQAWVPRFYVEAVVFHEMLHHDMPCVVKNGRRWFHTKEFRDRERAFEYHEVSERWEKEHLARLLRGG
jgi:hypothetical protein